MDFGIADGGGVALRESTSASNQTGEAADADMVGNDGQSPGVHHRQRTYLLGSVQQISQTVSHSDFGMMGERDNSEIFQQVPAPINFLEDRDIGGAGAASSVFDRGAVTAGQARQTSFGSPEVAGQALSERVAEVRAAEVRQGLAAQPVPQASEDASDRPAHVNVNRLVADLVQAQKRIEALEIIVASLREQQQHAGITKVAKPMTLGEHKASGTLSPACAARTSDEALQENLLQAQQAIAASLTSFANRHKTEVM